VALCTLGCPTSYHAVIHWRCGDQVFLPVESLTSLTYERTLNDTATATIVITKDSLDDVCCEGVGQIEPWLHELSIYRDADLVWQGPVMTVTETRAEVTVEAWDITAWLARIVNFSTKKYKRGEADVSTIAKYYIDHNLLNSRYACTTTQDGKKVDHACLTPFISRSNVGARPAYKPQDQTKYVVDLLSELVKSGLYWTTVGRRLILKGKPDKDDLPVATLTTDDLMGDFQIVRDGQEFATRAVATNGSSEKDRQTVTTGKSCNNPYGRVDWLVSSTDVPKCECEEKDCTKPGSGKCRGSTLCGPCEYSKTKKSWNCDTPASRQSACNKCIRDCVDDCTTECEADQRAALLDIAKAELKGRYPVPVSIAVDNGAALHPEAPLCFDQLVCGYRFDMRVDRACRKVQQAFVLSNVTVTWDEAGEKIAVGMTPMDVPGVDETGARAATAQAAGDAAAAAWFERGELPPPPAAAVEFADMQS
jgi:hypothetical protein